MKSRFRILSLISAVIGVGLFGYVILDTGIHEIWAHLRSLGFGFLIILAISSSRYLLRSFAWLRCMTPDERQVGFWDLWRARLAGEAIGDLTFGPVIAEPLRLVALGDKVKLSAGISSLAVENIAYTLSSCLMVAAGAIALIGSFGLEDSLRDAAIFSLSLVAAVIAVSLLIIGNKWKIASNLARRLSRLLITDIGKQERLEKKLDHLSGLEDYVFEFYAKRPADFFMTALSHIGFHLAGALEIYAALRLIGVDLTFFTAFMIESFNRAINIAFVFVPALVGVDEAGTGMLTRTLGFGVSAGVALAIIRKIRMFFWIGIGLLFLTPRLKGRS